MNIKIRDTNLNRWIDLSSCYWKAQDLFPTPIYSGIEIVKGTGVFCSKITEVNGKEYKSMVEIFEGDILSINLESTDECFSSLLYEVKYYNAAFRLDAVTGICGGYPMFTAEIKEIIGNKYDNPELLKTD